MTSTEEEQIEHPDESSPSQRDAEKNSSAINGPTRDDVHEDKTDGDEETLHEGADTGNGPPQSE